VKKRVFTSSLLFADGFVLSGTFVKSSNTIPNWRAIWNKTKFITSIGHIKEKEAMMDKTLTITEHKNREDYQFDFDKIAKLLLNQIELITKESAYRIREIEFYYYSDNHTDFYCHKNERQKKSNRLYFHRFKDPEKYDRLKRKGIDITIGNGSSNFGGILIRAIENIKTKKILIGIGNLTNQIITEIGGTFVIKDIYDSNKSVFDSSAQIHLKSASDNGFKIYKKQRQGLNMKKEDLRSFYLNSKYNYFTYPLIEILK
jgi:hypothetical protein